MSTYRRTPVEVLDGLSTSLREALDAGVTVRKVRLLSLVVLVVIAFVKVFRFTAVNAEVGARAGVSTKPADGVLVDLERRALHQPSAPSAPTAQES